MPNFLALGGVIIGAVAVALVVWWELTYPMHIKFPINNSYSKESLALYKKIRTHSSIEQFPVSDEVIDNGNLPKYLNVLQKQYSQSDKVMRDYIERIPYTKRGYQFFRSITVGRHNKVSITLITHRQYEDHHRILIAEISKEVTISLLSRIASSIKTILGWSDLAQQELEQIMTNLNDEKYKQIMENLMMHIMAENLQQRYANDLSISFSSTN